MEQDKFEMIDNESILSDLIHSVKVEESFASFFKFSSAEYFDAFLTSIGLSVKEFDEKSWYYDEIRTLHISLSIDDLVWVSTIGLVSARKLTDNSFVNSFEAQALTLESLINTAEELLKDDSVFDVDSNSNEKLSRITPSLFHNIVFFFELFGKSYLSLCKQPIKLTHTLSEIFNLVSKTMFEHEHNNSMFHAIILPRFKIFAEYIQSIPAGFKEQYIKYDENTMDNTVICVSKYNLGDLRNTIGFCRDFIMALYYRPDNCFQTEQGYYSKLLSNCTTPEQVSHVEKDYAFLLASEYSILGTPR